MSRSWLWLGGLVGLGGCASVSAVQLNSNLGLRPGAPSGLVYYMPAPYLIVARLPVVAKAGADKPPPKDAANLAAAADKPADAGGGGGGDKESPAGSTATTDAGFAAANPVYVLRIVYLPDHSRPMAISAKSGLWGAASFKPALTDGWMLTSLDATADSKTSETLTALGSLVGAAMGGGAAAPPAIAPAFAGRPPQRPAAGPDNSQVLRPGLYRFDYTAETGVLNGVEAVTYFCDTGPIKAPGRCP